MNMCKNDIDKFLRCVSVSKELKKHEREYDNAIKENVDGHLDSYIEQKSIVIEKLKEISEEC